MNKSVLPLAGALLTATFLLLIGTEDPLRALRAFFLSPLTNPFYLTSMLSLFSLLLLSGMGVNLAFSTGSFNLGGEGQSYAGGLSAALGISLLMPLLGSDPGPGLLALLLLLSLTMALLFSSLQGSLAGSLKNRLGIDPLISTFLISQALIPLFDSLIIGPLRDDSSNLLSMPPIPEALRLPTLGGYSRLHGGILISLMIWGLGLLIYNQSRRGFELRVSGAGAGFAAFCGIAVDKLLFVGMTISAGLHGLAGFIALTGVHHSAILGFTSGIGWNGIAVTLLAGNRFSRLPLGALIFAYLVTASNAAMVFSSFSFELSTVIQGVVFLLITVRIISKKKPASQPAEDKP